MCLNCGADLTGPFCSECGQRHRERLTFGDWVTQALAVFTDLDGPALRTLRDLTIRPGLAAHEYVEGRRARYVNPMRYALVTCGVLLAVIALLKSIAPGLEAMKTGIQLGNLAAAPLLALPVWAVFSGSRRSYADELVLQLYVRGHSLLALGLVALATWALGGRLTDELLIGGVVMLALWQVFALWQFHRARVRFVALRVLAAMLLTELGSLGVMTLATKLLAA